MLSITCRLIRLWLGVTVLLGLITFLLGLIYGWRSPEFVLVALGAVLIDLWLLRNCVETWKGFATLRWLWWKR